MPSARLTFLQMLRAPLIKKGQGAPFPTSYFNSVTAVAGAVTCNSRAGLITSEALVTAGLAAYTLTVTCDQCDVDSIIFFSVQNGTNTQGTTDVGNYTPATGSFVVKVNNIHASQALNGTIKLAFEIANPS